MNAFFILLVSQSLVYNFNCEQQYQCKVKTSYGIIMKLAILV
jgi:hypothetical protein